MTKSRSNREIEEMLPGIVGDLVSQSGAKLGAELMSQGCGSECENGSFAEQEEGI
jgi:hypothetical protein